MKALFTHYSGSNKALTYDVARSETREQARVEAARHQKEIGELKQTLERSNSQTKASQKSNLQAELRSDKVEFQSFLKISNSFSFERR